MHSVRWIALASTVLLLSACGGRRVTQPVIASIKMSTGDLTTDPSTFTFTRSFKPTDKKLVAVVSFSNIDEGSAIDATWYSPDERQSPLGRTTVYMQKGARDARFAIASEEVWKASPFLLRIDASSGYGIHRKTASGSLSFFIGMTDAQVRGYQKEIDRWRSGRHASSAASSQIRLSR